MIVITGAAGFIGSSLAKKLISNGEEVTGIDNLNYGYMDNLKEIINHPKFHFILGDIANPLLLKDIKADVEIYDEGVEVVPRNKIEADLIGITAIINNNQ